MDKDLDDWNPMDDDYSNEYFNSYGGGYGRRSPMFQQRRPVPPSPLEGGSDVHVSNIPPHFNERILFKMFSHHGTVLRVKITTTQTGLRLGKVGFATLDGAVNAIKSFRCSGLDGLRVQHYVSPSEMYPLQQSFQQPRGRGHQSYPGRGIHFTRGSMMGSRSSNAINFGYDDLSVPFQSLSIRTNPKERIVTVNSGKTIADKSPILLDSLVETAYCCLRCGNAGALKCMKCKGCYCSEECQKSHWPAHKKECVLSRERNTERGVDQSVGSGFLKQIISHVKMLDEQDQACGGYDTNSKIGNKRGGTNVTGNSQPLQRGSSGSNHQYRSGDEQGTNAAGNSQLYQKPSSDSAVQSRPGYDRSQNATGNSRPHQQVPSGSTFKSRPGYELSKNATGNSRPHPQDSSMSPLQSRCGNQHDPNAARNSQPYQHQLESSLSDFMPKPVATGSSSRESRFGHDEKNGNIKIRSCSDEMESQSGNTESPVFLKQFNSNAKVTFALNVPTKVLILHSDSPFNFFVRFPDVNDELASIMRNLQKDASNKPVPQLLAVDQMVAARFTDNVWYRAVVKEIKSDNTISVCYIDYGNVETTTMDNIRLLSMTLASIPRMSVLCSLAKVQPVTNSWRADDNRQFKQLVENCIMTTVCLKVVEEKHYVCLIDDKGTDIAEFMCVNDCARPKLSSSLDYWVVGENTSLTYSARNSESEIWFMSIHPAVQEEVIHVLNTLAAEAQPATNISFAQVGALVSACSPSDDVWYRAVVKKRTNEEILVQYIDFGNCETVTKVCCVPRKYLFTPSLAVLLVFESVADATTVHDSVENNGDIVAKVVEVHPDSAKIQLAIGNNLTEVMAYSFIHSRNVLSERVTPTTTNVDVCLATSVSSSASAPVHVHQELESPKPLVVTAQQEILASKPPVEPSRGERQELEPIPETDVKLIEHPIPTELTQVVVLNVESVDSLFVWVGNSPYLQTLPDLQESLSKASQSLSQMTRLPNVTQFVCGQYTEDDSWYRSRVIEVFSFDEVLVRYVDFGNTEVLPLSRMKPLLPDFASVPILASQVKLDIRADVCIDKLKDILTEASNDSWFMTVLDATTSPITVKLTKGERTLNELLGYELNESAVVPQTNTVSSPIREAGPVSPHVSQETPSPVAPIKADFDRVILDIGSRVTFMVFEVPSSGHMYGCVHNKEQLTAVDSLSKTMAEWCEKEHVPLAKPTAGVMCLAKSTAYNEWYRSEILSVHNDKYCVLYVDYGNSEFVSNADLRPILPEFSVLPLQAVECKLKEFNGSEEAVVALRNFLNVGIVVDVVGKEGDVYIIHCDELTAVVR